MPVTKRKAMANKKFTATNVEDITKKPQEVQALWKFLSKMDPEGDLWTANLAIVAVSGQATKDAPERTPAKLKLDAGEIELVTGFAIYDGPEPDDAETATGLIFTPYQLIEVAFAAGVRAEAARFTKAMAAAADKDGEEVEEDDEDFDDDEEVEADMDEMSDDVHDDDDDDDE